MGTERPNQREGYVEMDIDFLNKLEQHMLEEDLRHKNNDRRNRVFDKALADGTERMETIERDLNKISGVVKTADGFIRAMRLVSLVLALLIALGSWVFVEKNGDIKAMQVTLNQHSQLNSEMLTLLKRDIADTDRNTGKLERHVENNVRHVR